MTYKRDTITFKDNDDFFKNFNPDTNDVHWIEVTRNMYNQLHKLSLEHKPDNPMNIMNIPFFNGIQIKWNDLIPDDNTMIVVYSECDSKKEHIEKCIKFFEKYHLK